LLTKILTSVVVYTRKDSAILM